MREKRATKAVQFCSFPVSRPRNMFTKALILVLLGTTLTLASPIDFSFDSEVPLRGWKEDVTNWLQGIKETVKDCLGQSLKTFEQLIDEIKEQGHQVVKISKEKLEELKHEYNEIREKAKEAIEKEKQKWQNALHKAIKISKEKYEEVKHQAEHALEFLKYELESKLEDWKEKVNEAYEKAKNEEHGHVNEHEQVESYE